MNIASLEGHISDLKCLLSILDHEFDIIGITENRIRETGPTSNLNIEGYDFEFTPTKGFCGGTSLYVRKGYKYEKKNELCLSMNGIAESLFVEIKSEKCKNVIVGCIYRHHCKFEKFMKNFFENLIKSACDKANNKNIILMVDFNFDLLKTDSDQNVSTFYDFLSTFGFCPLILQPTRVTATSATLIDNIFVNNIETESIGGNITTSISDHFTQFCAIDVLKK